MARNVIVLDRDGTIVVDRKYLSNPAELAFLPGAAEGLSSLYEAGYRLVVVTNQSGVGRGLFSLQRLEVIHAEFTKMVEQSGVKLEGIYFCPHAPGARCDCRKPGVGLLLRAASELRFSLQSVIVVGDKMCDMELGERVGAPTILIDPSRPSDIMTSSKASFVVPDLVHAAKRIEQLNACSLRSERSRS